MNWKLLIRVLQEHFTPRKNFYHSRREVFLAKHKQNETSDQHGKNYSNWKKIAILRKIYGRNEWFLKLSSALVTKVWGKKLDEKEITVKLVTEEIRQDNHDKTHWKNFYPEKRNQARNTKKQEAERKENSQTIFLFPAERKTGHSKINVRQN